MMILIRIYAAVIIVMVVVGKKWSKGSIVSIKSEVIKLTTYEEKLLYEKDLRLLWRHCFHDSINYENFYFRSVYLYNQVYIIDKKGMIHSNPYLCFLNGKKEILHYIVGVGTLKEYRRTGIMRQLLEELLHDLYLQKEVITFLMPEKEAYYIPFDFVSISKKNKYVIQFDIKKHDLIYITYQNLLKNFKYNEIDVIFSEINQILKEKYKIFVNRDKDYFDLLWKEKACQKGDLIFCFQEKDFPNKFLGFFAYTKNSQTWNVEQYVGNLVMDEIVSGFFETKRKIFYEYPYMIRITNVECLFKLFSYVFKDLAQKNQSLKVIDSVIEQNNGIFRFKLINEEVFVERMQDQNKYDQEMTVKELAKYIFANENTIKNEIYFSEII